MMTSSRMPEDGEQLSRDESGEIEDDERKAISEEDGSENFSGHELAELKESKDEEGQSIPEEDHAESSSGEKIENVENESSPEKGHLKGPGSPYIKKINLALSIIIIIELVYFGGIGYFYTREEKSHINPGRNDRIPHQKEQKAQLNPLGIPKDQLLVLHSFVIPFEKNKRFTYISLSISFNLPNKELKREMIKKKRQLRGIIYDILSKEIKKIKDVPSLEKIKEVIIREVNMALSTGKVNELYITEFLAV